MKGSRVIVGRVKTEPKEVSPGIVQFTVHNNVNRYGQRLDCNYLISTSGKNARVCLENLKNGCMCCIEGDCDSNDENVVQTIKAERVIFLSFKDKEEGL